ncbi:ABC transporter permease [Brassicibacter mesophilus]|uniref:ABC transporter permease n=1 Tax=Brassicibacter mesophilus TaxID=745119 RepID=UPI003D245092
MNGYKQLTGRYMKSNKKRTLLTIVGIVLSIALISSIGLFFKGMQLAQIEEYRNTYGSYHLIFQKVDDKLLAKATNNPRVSRSGLLALGEEIKIGEKIVVSEMIASDKALELLPYKVKEGRLPQKLDEVAIEKWALKYIDIDAKVGDKIKVKDKQYTLVGILEDNIQNQIDDKAILLLKSNDINKEKAMLLVEISSKTNLKSSVRELKQLADESTIGENTYLLIVQGAGDINSDLAGLYLVIGVIILIVVIATIAVIYNSFQISVVERIKQFGLLRAVGATPKQIKRIVLREATILAMIGVPIGLLFGVIAIYLISIVFKLIGGDSVSIMKPSISPMILAISAIVGIISIYISALLPALFAGKVSPLVAISSRASITKEKFKRRKNVIARKIFGFEGELASKNIKRNRKRYRITVFSIIISVILFVTFTSLMDMSLLISQDNNESKNVHYSVVWDNNTSEEDMVIDNKIIDNIKSSKHIDKLYKIYKPYYFHAVVDKNKEIKEVQNIGKIYKSIDFEGEEKTLISSCINVYDKASLEISKKYIESGNIDLEKLNNENGVIIINKNRIYNQNSERTYYGPAANIKVGDEIYLQYNESLENKIEFGNGEVKKVKVMAVLEKDPFTFRGPEDRLKIITTDDVARKLTGKETIKPRNLNIIIKDVDNQEVAKAELEKILSVNPSLGIINFIDYNKNEKTALLMIQILLYGFVVVISLIGSVNIVNTLTTNIILRKREFAMLKSIGLTQKGLKRMIVLEGVLYGIVGSIYGSIIGSVLSYIMFKGLFSIREFGWKIPWSAMLIAGLCSIVIAYLSVLSPLSRIKKENLIEAIREE